MIVAIIGSSGFIGIELAKELSKKQYKTKLINRQSIKHDLMINCNQYLHELIKLLKDVDVVVHLASSSNPFTSEISPYLEIENLKYMLCLVKACTELGIKKIIYSSSGGVVYADTGYIHFEDESTSPTCSYGIGKITSENCLRLYAIRSKSDISILRISNPYGGTQLLKNNHGIVPYICKCINNEREIILYGNSIRDYIYIDDVVTAIISALNNNKGFNIYNIGTGVGTSLSELAYMISNILCKPIRIKAIQKRDFDANHNILNINKAKKILKWQPAFNLNLGLQKYLNNGK